MTNPPFATVAKRAEAGRDGAPAKTQLGESRAKRGQARAGQAPPLRRRCEKQAPRENRFGMTAKNRQKRRGEAARRGIVWEWAAIAAKRRRAPAAPVAAGKPESARRTAALQKSEKQIPREMRVGMTTKRKCRFPACGRQARRPMKNDRTPRNASENGKCKAASSSGCARRGGQAGVREADRRTPKKRKAGSSSRATLLGMTTKEANRSLAKGERRQLQISRQMLVASSLGMTTQGVKARSFDSAEGAALRMTRKALRDDKAGQRGRGKPRPYEGDAKKVRAVVRRYVWTTAVGASGLGAWGSTPRQPTGRPWTASLRERKRTTYIIWR